ncbi:MAG: MerR family transcriptional regulator [Bacilli bacterium]
MEHMKKNFTTGQFAKLANVTERTIRYYDKIGLLKPTFIMDNGYRSYCEEDFIKLQRIVSLKHLGFSLEEIQSMMINENKTTLNDSIDMQIELIEKKINHLHTLKESLSSTKRMILRDTLDWTKIVELIKLSTQEEKIIDHYRDASNLSIRIKLHEHFSVNKQGWFPWLYSQIDFKGVNRLLEVGCGNGELWKAKKLDLRNREIFLSDISEGMIDFAHASLGENYSYMVIDAHKIPFKKEYFDAIIANHVLFYLNDLEAGLEEISRVLSVNGVFYCSAYGKAHMKEISELAREFDERITLSDNLLYEAFGLDNGGTLLQRHFREVEVLHYEDALEVNDGKAIYDYIMSCHGNQKELLLGRMEEFMKFIENKIQIQGTLHITKDAGLFICRNKA